MTEQTPIRKLFADRQPGPEEDDIGPDFVAVAKAISAIAATRIILMVAVLTGSAIWIWTTLDPTRDRLYVAVAFSLVFVLPKTILYWKRG